MQTVNKLKRKMKTAKNDREFAISALLVAATELYMHGVDTDALRDELLKLLEEVYGCEAVLAELCDLVSEVVGCHGRRNSGARCERRSAQSVQKASQADTSR